MICKGCCTKAGVSYRLTKFAKLSQRLSNRVFHDACGLWIAIHTKPAMKRIVTTIITQKQYHLCFGVIIFPSFRHNCGLICCTFSVFFKGAKILKSGHKISAKRRRLNFAALFLERRAAKRRPVLPCLQCLDERFHVLTEHAAALFRDLVDLGRDLSLCEGATK